jgi:hypothetical protein
MIAFPEDIRAMLTQAGAGRFQGVMDGLVYFDSATTGSTLAMKRDGLTVARIKAHIAQSDAKFAEAK